MSTRPQSIDSSERVSAACLRSMTGYASVRRSTPMGELTVSLRSVNHRGLDLHFHPASELAPFENAMRTVLKESIRRGHIEIRGFLLHADAGGAAAFNRDFVARYVAAFRSAAEEHGVPGSPDLNVPLSMAGVLISNGNQQPLDSSFEPTLIEAITACVHELNAYREREGNELLRYFKAEIAGLEDSIGQIDAIRSDALNQFQDRLRERLNALLADSGISPNRLVEEAAILADRSDIEEELTRLRVHAAELNRILDEGGEAGKRIDFLLQEMNRETNTILSKTSGIGDTGLTITNRALAIKGHIEKIREQALNIE